jgi:hypothetical protein
MWNISSIERIMVLANVCENLHPTAEMHKKNFGSFITDILINHG